MTATQLSTYYLGTAEMIGLRRDFEAKHGAGNLKEMRDTMFSFGTIAAKYVRELMKL